MSDLPLEQVPREGEIIEVLYRLSGPTQTHVDLTVVAEGEQRRLRFTCARVVQFQEDPPAILRGLDVQDIRDQQLGDMALWVSVADGAITFWAKTVTEMTHRKPEARPVPRDAIADQIPLIAAEQVREWGPSGTPRSSFRYRSQGGSGMLRRASVGTRRYS
jgi:hypothetical protein